MLLEQTWCGISNNRYDFQVYSNDSAWPYWGGVYLLCSRTDVGWVVHYAGESDDLSQTLTPSEDNMLHSSALCATHVHILLECNPLKRKRITRDLITTLNPSFNNEEVVEIQLSQVA